MKIIKTNWEKNFYVASFKLVNILGPVVGGLLVIGNLVMIIVQTRPLQLPVTHILNKGDRVFSLEVATTPMQLQKGLKFRASIPRDRGMLFNLGGEIHNVPFWMYKVNFPLDIFYLKDNVVTTAVYNAEPCHKRPCTIYQGRVANFVLELPSGVANIKVGDKLNIQQLSNDVGFDNKKSLVTK